MNSKVKFSNRFQVLDFNRAPKHIVDFCCRESFNIPDIRHQICRVSYKTSIILPFPNLEFSSYH
jgi:hypothetical protein